MITKSFMIERTTISCANSFGKERAENPTIIGGIPHRSRTLITSQSFIHQDKNKV